MTFEKLFDEYLKSPGFTKLATRSKIIYMGSGTRISKHLGAVDVKKLKRFDPGCLCGVFVCPRHGHSSS